MELECWGVASCEIIFKCDIDHPIVALARRVVAYRGGQVILEHSPNGESQTNGHMKRGVRTIKYQTCTLKAHIEYNLKIKLDPEYAILQWLVKWVGTTLNRYSVVKNGRIGYERMRTQRCQAFVAQFDENVFYKESIRKTGRATSVDNNA